MIVSKPQNGRTGIHQSTWKDYQGCSQIEQTKAAHDSKLIRDDTEMTVNTDTCIRMKHCTVCETQY